MINTIKKNYNNFIKNNFINDDKEQKIILNKIYQIRQDRSKINF